MLIEHVMQDGTLSDAELSEFVAGAFSTTDLDGKKVLCIIPDATRSMPMPAMFRAICKAARGRVAKLDFIVALGTHPAMSDEAICRLVGITPEERERDFADVGLFNHEWQNPDALTSIGKLSKADVEELSGGMLSLETDVIINKRVLEADLSCVVGPVFPHEVVGVSGGNKYFFPGVAAADILDLFHWLGALITSPVIIGTKDTPVRAVIDRAASMINVEKCAFCLNVQGDDCSGIFYGTPEEAWSAAADMALETHIVYKDKPFNSVLAICPPMYDEIWVAGKCMYKLEPVVADGGELIIYAPHITDISESHGHIIKQVGYHTRDYFLGQPEMIEKYPRAILAHSTHVRGLGTYENGVEKCRVDVILATAIPEEVCKSVNLGYRDPATIDAKDWEDREDEGKLLVARAGEDLHRMRVGGPTPPPLPSGTW